MEKNKDLEQGLRAIKRVADNPSWFREHPHYWALASLPFAYAMACVEVISKSSEKAGEIYSQIVEAWGKQVGAQQLHQTPRVQFKKTENLLPLNTNMGMFALPCVCLSTCKLMTDKG